jgi:hypothetical protein
MFGAYRILLWVALAGLFPFADSAPPNPIQFTEVTAAAGIKFVHFDLGARVRVVAGRSSQIREIAGGGSYLSQSDLRANFGLGKVTRAETVEVQWPSGQHQVFRNVEADKFYLIDEGRQEMGQQQLRAPAHHEKH